MDMAKHSMKDQGAPKKRAKAPSTKAHLGIREVRDQAVVMRDGALRAVLAVSSVNFALKSDDEQHAIVLQYVQFLNALDFPLQIIIQSRKLDIAPYVEQLRTKEVDQSNELLKVQIADYRRYIEELVQLGEIMTKSFYVVVPYSPLSDSRKSFVARAQEAFSPARLVKLKVVRFRERHQELMQRTAHVQDALRSIGLKSEMLDTQALIELMYRLYNPLTAHKEPMVATEKLVLEA